MLVPLTNEPRDYSWGSTTLIPALEGRVPTDRPEAEVWFGDHPAAPARTPAGARLDEWLAEAGHESLPYLLKLLAAASALSIQAHPSRNQAIAGFAREEASGPARDAADRTYRDANHKPELIVAVSDEFRALAGIRDLAGSRRLAAALGRGGRPLAERLEASDASPRALVAWALSAEASDEVGGVIAAALTARSEEFAQELELARTLNAGFPGDPGIVVALLMNLVTLRRGQGLFVPAGVLHAYLEGLGVEIMAASDNVLRGGLTPKHIDVDELVEVLVDATGSLPPVEPRPVAANVAQYDVPVADFSLRRVVLAEGDAAEIPVDGGPAILLTISGSPTAAGAAGDPVDLRPGAAVLSADETSVRLTGPGEVFVAARGESAEPDPVS